MNKYDFSLVVSNRVELTESVADALYAAGCDDATPGTCEGILTVDFHQRSFLYGHPPKVVWIRRGNCSTATIESILREHQDDLVKFAESEQGSFLALL